MKDHLYSWHLSLDGLTPHRRYVLEKLCHYADAETLEASVTIDRLHAHVGGGKRTIDDALKQLRDAELIVDTGRKAWGPRGGKVTIYRIAPELDLNAVSASNSASSLRSSPRRQKKKDDRVISKEIKIEEVGNELPDEMNAAFIRVHGEQPFKSYLKDARWDPTARTITTKLAGMAKKLNDDFRPFLHHWKVTVVGPKVVAHG